MCKKNNKCVNIYIYIYITIIKYECFVQNLLIHVHVDSKTFAFKFGNVTCYFRLVERLD